MSVKFSNTTADYIEWNEALNLVHRLYADQKYTLSLFVACGIFFGLRAGDLLTLTWCKILDVELLEVVEQKTKKKRVIKINVTLQKHIKECYKVIHPNKFDFCFVSQKGVPFSIQRLNFVLKEMKHRYRLKISNISTHSLRKSFGRRVYEVAGVNSENALVKLSEIFNHSNTRVTRIYLGLKKEELLNVYDELTF